jgi:hypothetical protein
MIVAAILIYNLVLLVHLLSQFFCLRLPLSGLSIFPPSSGRGSGTFVLLFFYGLACELRTFDYNPSPRINYINLLIHT